MFLKLIYVAEFALDRGKREALTSSVLYPSLISSASFKNKKVHICRMVGGSGSGTTDILSRKKPLTDENILRPRHSTSSQRYERGFGYC